MSTMTEDRDESMPIPRPPLHGDLVAMPHCKRCNLAYLPTKSTSALRLTYCSFLCELGDLGFSMAGLEHMERVKKEPAESAPQPVAAE
ncbi:MAG: hypothetical protein AMXMBFR80_21510 [Dehalococcoidia bacterium]|nr:hypothetical protein [Tepidiformaceae bacterium]